MKKTPPRTPMVARHKLPWECVPAHRGVGPIATYFPGYAVVPSRQPRALRRNPVGIGTRALRTWGVILRGATRPRNATLHRTASRSTPDSPPGSLFLRRGIPAALTRIRSRPEGAVGGTSRLVADPCGTPHRYRAHASYSAMDGMAGGWFGAAWAREQVSPRSKSRRPLWGDRPATSVGASATGSSRSSADQLKSAYVLLNWSAWILKVSC